jgi:hypothetical protein
LPQAANECRAFGAKPIKQNKLPFSKETHGSPHAEFFWDFLPAPQVRSHYSLGQRPRELGSNDKEALKARFIHERRATSRSGDLQSPS